MTVQVNPLLQYVTPQGTLTVQGLELFRALLQEIAALQARVAELEP